MECNICQYQWMSRVLTPKACPRCKRRFDYVNIKSMVVEA